MHTTHERVPVKFKRRKQWFCMRGAIVTSGCEPLDVAGTKLPTSGKYMQQALLISGSLLQSHSGSFK